MRKNSKYISNFVYENQQDYCFVVTIIMMMTTFFYLLTTTDNHHKQWLFHLTWYNNWFLIYQIKIILNIEKLIYSIYYLDIYLIKFNSLAIIIKKKYVMVGTL